MRFVIAKQRPERILLNWNEVRFQIRLCFTFQDTGPPRRHATSSRYALTLELNKLPPVPVLFFVASGQSLFPPFICEDQGSIVAFFYRFDLAAHSQPCICSLHPSGHHISFGILFFSITPFHFSFCPNTGGIAASFGKIGCAHLSNFLTVNSRTGPYPLHFPCLYVVDMW